MMSRQRNNAPPADPEEVRAAIHSAGAGAYLFLGDNGVEIEDAISSVTNDFTTESTRAFNCDVFHADDPDCTGEAIVNAAMEYPVLAEVRVVVLRGVEAVRASIGNELALLTEKPLQSTVLLITGEKIDERTKWAAALKKQCRTFAFTKPRNLDGWVRRRAGKLGVTISDEAATLLSEYLGTDVFRAAQEVEKLALYVQPRTNIAEEDVEAIVGITRDDTVYQLNDLIVAGHAARAMATAHRIQENGMQAATIAGFIVQHWLQLRAASELQPGRPGLKEMLGENRDWIVRKLSDQARSLGKERIRRGFRLALAAESAMKSSWLDDKTSGLDTLICQLAVKSQPGTRRTSARAGAMGWRTE
jgi:DNA polymerase-3 subunit delta